MKAIFNYLKGFGVLATPGRSISEKLHFCRVKRLYTSWPLALRTSGASLRRERGTSRERFFPKSYKDFALSTSCTVLRRIGTVPFGHRVPFKCHVCHAMLSPSSPSFTFIIPLGISVGIFYNIHQITPHF